MVAVFFCTLSPKRLQEEFHDTIKVLEKPPRHPKNAAEWKKTCVFLLEAVWTLIYVFV